MKIFLKVVAFILIIVLASCKSNRDAIFGNNRPFVDAQTPKSAKPFKAIDNLTDSHHGSKWTLVFSDEFNDNKVDVTKWTVENTQKKRVDIMLYADDNQVEEKDGKVHIYYRKAAMNDTTYMAGRFNSKDKFTPTYGYMEAKIHLIKPNGYQMAFWMMPQGNGMASATKPDGTANDGAEIDIVEGNKLKSFSNGIHWDGYAKIAHKSNGKQIEAANFYDEEYHIFGFEWTTTFLKFYLDGKIIREMTDPKLIPHVAHFLYFSGSCFGKSDWVDGDVRQNEFIQNGGVEKAYVDYVRVYQTKN